MAAHHSWRLWGRVVTTGTLGKRPMAEAAERLLDEWQVERPRRPGGSSMGRLMKRSRTRAAGIRFEWVLRTIGPVLRVVATWTDRLGQPHHTSFSVQCNGLEGALDRAIASRISCGAPQPNREDLLQRLQKEFATAPYVADRMATHTPGRTAPASLFTPRAANEGAESRPARQGSLASMEASVASSQNSG